EGERAAAAWGGRGVGSWGAAGREGAGGATGERGRGAALGRDRSNFCGAPEMIRLIYNLLWPIGLLLFLPSYLAKMFRRGGYRKDFGQRLGLYSIECRRRLHGKSPTWIHAVSVGEVVIALKLAEQLRALRPDLK